MRYSIARALILMLAFAWPFGAILYIPFLDVTLLPLAGAVVVILALIDAIGNRDRRPPFALVWPVMAAILLVWFDAEIDSKTQYTISLALFLGIAQFAQGGRFMATCLRATAAGGAVVAALAAVNVVVESVNVIGAGVFHMTPPGILFAPMLTSPEAFWEAALALVLCLFAAFEGWLRAPRPRTAIAVCAITGSIVPMMVLMPDLIADARWLVLPETAAPGPVHFSFMLVLVWLAARVGTRVAIGHGEHGTGTRLAPFLAVVAIVGVVLLTPHLAFPGAILVPAILAGGTSAPRYPQFKTLPVWLCTVPAVVLLGLNLFHVYPTNQDDPRNYEAFLRRDVEVNRLDRAWTRVSVVRASHYLEPRACLWSARLALAYDRPYQAAHEFANAVGKLSHQGSLLPAPTQSEIDDFLVRIRDYCSNLSNPKDQFAYEKALAAAGKDASVLPLLRTKAAMRPSTPSPVDRALMTDVLRTVLGCGREELEKGELTNDEMWALILSWGADVQTGVIPRLQAPCAVVVRFGVFEFTGDILGGPKSSMVMGYATIRTASWPLHFKSIWGPVSPPLAEWTFGKSASGTPAAELTVQKTPATAVPTPQRIQRDSNLVVTMAPDSLPPYPDKPAILILLP